MKLKHYAYRRGHFFIENVDVAALARKVGTPFYAYTRAGIEDALAGTLFQ